MANMFARQDQENLTNNHARIAASKPLNQTLQSRTPAPQSLKTPFRNQQDENKTFALEKGKQGDLQTPVLQLQPRQALGAKSINAKALQTPAALQQQTRKPSARTSRTTRNKIFVDPEPTIEPSAKNDDIDEEDEPDYGHLPPNPVPLPDPDMEFPYDPTFPQRLVEEEYRANFPLYFISPRCPKTGRSLSLIREEEIQKKAMEDELERCLRLDIDNYRIPMRPVHSVPSPDPVKRDARPARLQESQPATLKARSASIALSQILTSDRPPVPQFAKQTVSSKQKRKSTWFVRQDSDEKLETGFRPKSRNMMPPPPLAKASIGFPKAKKPVSIIPHAERLRQSEQRTKQVPGLSVIPDISVPRRPNHVDDDDDDDIDVGDIDDLFAPLQSEAELMSGAPLFEGADDFQLSMPEDSDDDNDSSSNSGADEHQVQDGKIMEKVVIDEEFRRRRSSGGHVGAENTEPKRVESDVGVMEQERSYTQVDEQEPEWKWTGEMSW